MMRDAPWLQFLEQILLCFRLTLAAIMITVHVQDGNEMRDAINRRCPSKIDIGPVYTATPHDRLKFGGRCSQDLFVSCLRNFANLSCECMH